MRYADIQLKLVVPGASQEMRVTGSDRRLDLDLAVGAYRAVGLVHTAFGRIGQAVRLWKVRRKSFETLSRLDDHLLRDIGLRRDQIPAIIEQLATQQTERATGDVRPGFGARSSSDEVSLNG